MHSANDSFLVIYNHANNTFSTNGSLIDNITGQDAVLFNEQLLQSAVASADTSVFKEYLLKLAGDTEKWFRVGFITIATNEIIHLVFTDISASKRPPFTSAYNTPSDILTGLMTWDSFITSVQNELSEDSSPHALIYLDIVRFKAINELFGIEEGNNLLRYVAATLQEYLHKDDPVGRLNADRFVTLTKATGDELDAIINNILEKISEYPLSIEVMCNIGIYITDDNKLSIDTMIDRANLALSNIKGSYAPKYNYYTDTLRSELITEQEITGIMVNALEEGQFILNYQPKYDHSTGMILSAEALTRWKHPEKGIISPADFIPIFEKNGFITKLDYYVFEQVCIFLRKCMDNKYTLIPVSINFSRHDILQPDFVDTLERIRTSYDIPVKLLHIEITESAIVGNSERANAIIAHLHEYGYIVEMDDFGSGYSSLNVLKEIDFDIVKLDMMFMSNKPGNNRGGTILNSIVQMAKWLGMPVIAEGVETVTQADYLKSIGCNYIQGYLYSRPLPEEDYIAKISGSLVGAIVPQLRLDERLNACDFWDPTSIETLIFSNYVGAAAIFTYDRGKLEILRVNQKYLKELSMNLTEKELIHSDPWIFFDEANRKIYEDMLNRAILSGEEEECETWRDISSKCCGNERFCIRTTAVVIGKSADCYLIHAMIRNVTAEKERLNLMLDNEKRFMTTAEQVKIYFWEYSYATKEMRPCFRCMRDLGLPAVVTNYPQSAFEMGIFPMDYYDMYNDWFVQLENGVMELEGVIPLTIGRIPFMVRYTNELDENGRPVKAYGSATLITDN